MKLSERTLRILKNFATINPSLLIEKGSRIRTCSVPGSVYAVADVEEEFPREFAIFSLSKLLKVLELFKDPEIEFEEDRLHIHEGTTRVNFAYCMPDLIVHPPKKEIKTPPDTVNFELRSDVFSRVLKAMSVLEFEEISFVSDDEGKLRITTKAGNKSSSDSFSEEIGECEDSVSTSFASDNLKMIPGNYLVKLNSMISHWSSLDDEGLQYWIAPEAK